jgi:surface-anchored protein/LPXTG-motif cell wall-anchored protein
MDRVSGPGQMNLFLTDSFGTATSIFSGSQPYPQSTKIAPNTHAHGNWAFSKPGYYTLDMSMSAADSTGKRVSDSAQLILAVGVDPAGAPASREKNTAPTNAQAEKPTVDSSVAAEKPLAAPGQNETQNLPRTGASEVLLIAVGAGLIFLILRLGFFIRRRRNLRSADVGE